jgi:hypothetical protein
MNTDIGGAEFEIDVKLRVPVQSVSVLGRSSDLFEKERTAI